MMRTSCSTAKWLTSSGRRFQMQQLPAASRSTTESESGAIEARPRLTATVYSTSPATREELSESTSVNLAVHWRPQIRGSFIHFCGRKQSVMFPIQTVRRFLKCGSSKGQNHCCKSISITKLLTPRRQSALTYWQDKLCRMAEILKLR